ncbi:flagellar biosynthetic protein FliO [Porticoccaceae bacterium LTM1]|nr:flagellar biosynthetic protein FliO [Porticoccaceae bacterium LTM1]
MKAFAPKSLLILFLIAGTALAADPEQAIPLAEKTNSGAYILQLVMSLAVVLVGIGALAWLLKKLNRMPGNDLAKMHVLAAMSLGARERAVLVQVGDKQMLLGVSPGRVTTLHVFDEPVIDPNQKTPSAAGNHFATILSGLGKGGDRS